MSKIENIRRDIQDIDRKIRKLEAQKNLLKIQLESIENYTEQPAFGSTERYTVNHSNSFNSTY